MNKTDEILERLKDWQPSLDNPDELTERIMAKLPSRETAEQWQWKLILGRSLQYVSTIAAACLIGLFLYQQSPTKTTNEVPHYYTSSRSAGSTLKEVYTRPQQQSGLISYNQLKKKLYEKK